MSAHASSPIHILAVSTCAVPASARSLVAIAEWAAGLPPRSPRRWPSALARPCESTIRRVLSRVDGEGLDVVLRDPDRRAAARRSGAGCGRGGRKDRA